MNDLNNPQILIGHDSAVLIAKFSPVQYTDNEGNSFNLLATSDKNGNLIVWKIMNSQFKILTEIENLSESNITYLLWSNNGTYLFVSNSYGSVYILEFNEFFKSMVITAPSKENVNKSYSLVNNIDPNLMTTDQPITRKKRIVPELLGGSNASYVPDSHYQEKRMTNEISLNPNQQIQDCLRCQKQKFNSLETKSVSLKLDTFENKNVYLQWENKVYDNFSTVQLRMKHNHILFSNKFENKLIRLFTYNNQYFAFYDTNNLLNVFTLFNTMVRIRWEIFI